jgi:hypothetical protein
MQLTSSFPTFLAGIALLKHKDRRTRIPTYHMVAEQVMAKDVKPGKVTMVEGSRLNITRCDYGVKVDNVQVVANGHLLVPERSSDAARAPALRPGRLPARLVARSALRATCIIARS